MKPPLTGSTLPCCRSLSARRAWIETMYWIERKKGAESLSARRAWIETFP